QTYSFIDGALETKKSKAKTFKGASGVKVRIRLAKEVYKSSKIDGELLKKRIIDLAYNNPGLKFTFNGEEFLYKKGLLELAERISPEGSQVFGDEAFIHTGVNERKVKYKAQIDV